MNNKEKRLRYLVTLFGGFMYLIAGLFAYRDGLLGFTIISTILGTILIGGVMIEYINTLKNNKINND